jgi:hypothetical protein
MLLTILSQLEAIMKTAGLTLLIAVMALPAVAQVTPGSVVASGAPFPIVADYDRDGLDDLIQEKNVILNRGGRLTEIRPFSFGNERVVGAPDVNGDGILDLLTVGSSVLVPPSLPQPPREGDGYRLYIGDASGNYGEAIGISTGLRPAIADVNADGKDDFVILAPYFPSGITDTATDVTVLRSRGDGTFDTLESFRMPANPQVYFDPRLLTGDLDHDGLTDIVMRTVYDLVVLRGRGNGRFDVQSRYLPQAEAFGTQSARLGDIDGDSNLDVILPAIRGIRVFYGDGHGDFKRTSHTPIAKLHEIELPAGYEFLAPKPGVMEPRNIAIGHFTNSSRDEIAAGTVEGDIVVFGYERGAVREVSRSRSEFWHVDVRTGAFTNSGLNDIYAGGTLIWGDVWPRPRLFLGQEKTPTAEAAVNGRRRGVRPPPGNPNVSMQLRGDCLDEATSAHWMLKNDEVFATAKRGGTTMEAVFDGPTIYIRLTAPDLRYPALGILRLENSIYSGTLEVVTPCGAKSIFITANN